MFLILVEASKHYCKKINLINMKYQIFKSFLSVLCCMPKFWNSKIVTWNHQMWIVYNMQTKVFKVVSKWKRHEIEQNHTDFFEKNCGLCYKGYIELQVDSITMHSH